MRRSDREVTEPEKINEIILSCDCCRLGFIDKDSTYIVPLNFGFTVTDDKRIFYFHGAKEGKKIELIKSNVTVGFELDTNHELTKGKSACQYSFKYQSIIGNGKVSLVNGKNEKQKALCIIMEHYTGKKDWTFDDSLNSVAILKLDVTELSCKEHK
ncbi:MAG: pyridoxamine 5'-phosphate oxidase family protein [Clostridia bacterium]|jgi:nitroimidazol reductase NimA-like FMN-containing flavoprotein (pyridoxamine 5'-phosphate oxidase superfamily)|nr:pyridoxamine 5'-phosphate oxidase family protein [Clostridia bacterium]